MDVRCRSGKLGRWRSVPLAVSSVAGSGLLFLPSAVYVEAGRATLVVWMVAAALCLSMLAMFADAVRSAPAGAGIEALVRAGLGDALARCVAPLFIAVVSVGLPAGAAVAGRYVASALGAGPGVATVVMAAIVATAVAINLAGVRASDLVHRVGVALLVAMALGLVAAAGAGAPPRAAFAVVPDALLIGPVLSGIVLAFWAFAGFENLTFLNGELADPRRDFLPVSVIALGTYGVLTVLLTAVIAMRIPHEEVDATTGLVQLARLLPAPAAAVGAVTAVAICSMLLNAVAWVHGVSRLIADAAATGIVPRALGACTPHGVPRRAVGAMSALLAICGTALAWRPGVVVEAVAAASAIFVVLYVMSVAAYLRVRGLTARSLPNVVVLAVLAVSLAQSGWRSSYAAVVLAAAVVIQLRRRDRRRRRPADDASMTTIRPSAAARPRHPRCAAGGARSAPSPRGGSRGSG